MALTVKEIMLVLRGDNQMSPAVRRAAADVATLQKNVKASQLSRSGIEKNIAARTAAAATTQRQAEAAQAKFVQMQKDFASRQDQIDSQRKRALAQQIELQEKLNALIEHGAMPDDSAYEATMLRLSAATKDIDRLSRIQQNLPAQAGAALNEQSNKITILNTRLSEQQAEISRLNDEWSRVNAEVALYNQQLEQADRGWLSRVSWAMAMGHGGGGSSGMWIPWFGRGGFGGMRIGQGLPAFGSLLAISGFGAERVLTSALGIAGSLGGAAVGGGLYGLGLLGPLAVGAGTNMAGIGQAAGDIKTVSGDLKNLQQQIALYGRGSTQAAQAQRQLNYDLGQFSPVARGAVLQAAKTQQSFRALFDKLTGPAEKIGAQIINQAMNVGKQFLPTIGQFARQNMGIIQRGLQPLFAWMQGTGQTQGLGIFQQLEQTFQQRLPTAVHAGTQAFEVFLNIVNDASKHTGGFLTTIDKFFTKLNTPTGLAKINQEVGKLIDLFKTWFGMFTSIGKLVYDLFKPAVGLGKDFAQQITNIVNATRNWLNTSSMQATLRNLFSAHLAQLNALFNVIKSFGPALASLTQSFLNLEAAAARGTLPVFNAFGRIVSTVVAPAISAIAKAIAGLSNIPFFGNLLGAGAAFLILEHFGERVFGKLGGLVTGFLRLIGLMGPAVTEAAGTISSEAGMINVAFATKLGVVGAIALLVQFHGQVQSVVGALGGMKNALGLVATAFAGLAIVRTVGNITTAFSTLRASFVALGSIRSLGDLSALGSILRADTASVAALRSGLLGIAGLTVTAFILIKEDKAATGAIRNALGSTLQKEINAVTGQPIAQSFSQQIGNWLTGKDLFTKSDLLGTIRGVATGNIGEILGSASGWNQGVRNAQNGIQRISIAYRAWLNMLHQPGTPAALQKFLYLLHTQGIDASSSARQVTTWLDNMHRAASRTPNLAGIHNLNKALQAVLKTEFELARQQPFGLGGMFARGIGAVVGALGAIKHKADEARQAQVRMLQSATQQGVVATRTYRQLYNALVKAKEAAALDPTSLAKQRAVVEAQAALQRQVSQQQYQAAQKAADASVTAWKNANGQIAANTQETFQNVLNSVQGMFNQLQQNEQTIFGTLFQGPYMQSPAMQNYVQWGGIPTGKMLVKDLASQLGQFRAFHHALDELRRRGAPEALIQQLEALGPSALKQIQALARLSGPELRHYFSMFAQAQRMINQQALRDLHAQLESYRRYGRSIALAIVAGLQDENASVLNALKRMVRQIFPGLPRGSGPTYARPRHPSTVRTPRAHAAHTSHTIHHRTTTTHIHTRQHPPPPRPRHMASYTPRHTQQAQTIAYVRQQPHIGPHHVLIDAPHMPWRVLDTKRTQEIHGAVRVLNHPRITRTCIEQPRMPWHVKLTTPSQHAGAEIHHHYEYHVNAPTGSNIDTQVRHADFASRARHRRHPLRGDRYDL